MLVKSASFYCMMYNRGILKEVLLSSNSGHCLYFLIVMDWKSRLSPDIYSKEEDKKLK